MKKINLRSNNTEEKNNIKKQKGRGRESLKRINYNPLLTGIKEQEE